MSQVPDPTSPATPPVVLCAGGQDPSGGAGLGADAEAIRAAGAHAAGLITCLTVQDTCGVTSLIPQQPQLIAAQWRAIVGDSRIAAIKIGLLGDASLVVEIAGLARGHPGVPIVLDPVLASGAGDPLADLDLIAALTEGLLGCCTLTTPNLPEAQALSGRRDPDDCAAALRQAGCPWVMITGTHAPTTDVINRLYGPDGARYEWRWPRLPHDYHGSGCTLASAIAARLAFGQDLVEAVAAGQAYTWETLARARRTGRCQLTPNRLFVLDRIAETHG